MSIQFTVLGFEPTTFRSRVSSHNRKTMMAPTHCLQQFPSYFILLLSRSTISLVGRQVGRYINELVQLLLLLSLLQLPFICSKVFCCRSIVSKYKENWSIPLNERTEERTNERTNIVERDQLFAARDSDQPDFTFFIRHYLGNTTGLTIT